MTSLDLDKKYLSKFKKWTATATARSFTRFKFPNPPPNFGLGNVDSLTIDNITREFHFMYFNHHIFLYCIELTKYLNPTDISSNTKLRKAIGNYFASIKYTRKMKSMIPSMKKLEKKNGNSIINEMEE
jgi:hypothetical protein